MHIRRAVPTDEPSIRACAEAAYARYVMRIGRRPAPMDTDFAAWIAEGHVDVIEVDDRVVGYAVFYPTDHHLHLENIAITPAFAGRGLGTRLLEHVEDCARRSGAGAVELYTNEHMTENLQLYPRRGYAETGRRRESGFARVYFRKTL